MKKLIVIVLSILTISAVASAQPKAVGLRGGYGAQLSYEHFSNAFGGDFLEFEVGLSSFNALHAEALVNYALAGNAGAGFCFYAGYGAAAGFNFGENAGINVAAAAQVGIEYTFPVPVQISLDIRPMLGITTAVEKGAGLYLGYYPAFGIRYAF